MYDFGTTCFGYAKLIELQNKLRQRGKEGARTATTARDKDLAHPIDVGSGLTQNSKRCTTIGK